ncbi:uncharacterised protein [Saccharolobus solfataricus]|uniref:Uncharacterized protein ORF-c10_015 n=1 Tax=Saccharolobus solfataricus TaxID=2287 RepID=Q9UXA4_SACSO|nr:hypothetical protein [Saccharolobus solfataricus P2]SAI84296.1 uncharacterised protein [Saccharolobus solfataricus]
MVLLNFPSLLYFLTFSSKCLCASVNPRFNDLLCLEGNNLINSSIGIFSNSSILLPLYLKFFHSGGISNDIYYHLFPFSFIKFTYPPSYPFSLLQYDQLFCLEEHF